MNGETDRRSLRLSATLLLVGQVLYILVTQFHADGPANNHAVVFAEYATNGIWTAIHVAQFLSMVILVGGLFTLLFAVEHETAYARWLGRFGAASAIVALALYGALQAVDGVANKQADVAWMSATGAEKSARFASAEAIRWIEWGMRSYHDIALGIALVSFAAACARSAEIPRPIAYLMGLSGVTYLVQGWIVGSEGFSQTESILIVLAWVFSLAWMIWLAVISRRLPDSVLYER
ncbi:MAG TPA: DUF4386 family protein [Gemmatimonadaceae bacterium]|nr:DUF4386 family protein [Gemmatimonadaceae bacterium]